MGDFWRLISRVISTPARIRHGDRRSRTASRFTPPGPTSFPNYRALTRAVHTHLVPAGAFRGFGVPQACLAVEQLYDELATASAWTGSSSGS
jgi:CO/xanthine dehydrogenase Mo-binding subunit